MSREADFQRIRRGLSESIVAEVANAALVGGDSLTLIEKIPSHSVSLILTDPPYHSTKKDNIFGDTLFGSDKEF